MSLENLAYAAAIFCLVISQPLVSVQAIPVHVRRSSPQCPRQFEPLLVMAGVIRVSRVVRIKGPNGPLVSRDSGTHYNTQLLTKSLVFYNLKCAGLAESQ